MKLTKNDVSQVQLRQGAKEFFSGYSNNILSKTVDPKNLGNFNLNEMKKIATGVISDFSDKNLVLQIYKAGIPLVQIYHPMENLPIDTIVQDDILGIQLAYNHLIAKGHRRICFLDQSLSLLKIGEDNVNNLKRKLGYQFAAEQSGTYDPELIFHVDTKNEFLAPNHGCFSKIAKSGATAIVYPFIIDHQMVLKRLQQEINKPNIHKNTGNAIKNNNFGIVSWGERNTNEFPEVTTHIDWDKAQMGKEGVRRLLERINEPDLPPVIITIPTKLVVGNSSGKGPYYNKNLE